MAINLNDEQEQRLSNYGPVPAGSKVLCRITLEKPKYAAPDDECVSVTKGGLLGLYAKIEVIQGKYEGVRWYENIWLPKRCQSIPLTDGQTTACNRSGAIIRAIVEAYRRVSSKATDTRSCQERQINAWTDMDGMEFPAVMGISKDPYEAQNGNTYWNNYVVRVLTPDAKEFNAILAGKEFISDGPVTGEKSGQGQKYQTQEQDYAGMPGRAFPSEQPGNFKDNFDRVPF
jgi:hypothetical protein